MGKKEGKRCTLSRGNKQAGGEAAVGSRKPSEQESSSKRPKKRD